MTSLSSSGKAGLALSAHRPENFSAPSDTAFRPETIIATLLAETPSPQDFPQAKQSALEAELGWPAAQELHSLAQEKDPVLFFDGLLSLASRLESQDKPDWALRIYAAVSQSTAVIPGAAAEKATQRSQAIQGQGAFGGRFEFLLQRFAKDATDARTILPMLAGSIVGQLAETAVLGRFSGIARTGILANPWTSRAVASVAAYVPEALTFGTLNHVLAGGTSSLGEDLARSALSLATLKLATFAGNQAFLKMHGLNEFGLTQVALPQFATFAGMLASHRLEEGLGLRQKTEGATLITDTLSGMLSMAVGAHLGHSVLGSSFGQFQQELKLRASQGENRGNDLSNASFGKGLEPALASTLPFGRSEEAILFHQPVLSKMKTPTKGVTVSELPIKTEASQPPQRSLKKSFAMAKAKEVTREDLDMLEDSHAEWRSLRSKRGDSARLHAGLFSDANWRQTWSEAARRLKTQSETAETLEGRESGRAQLERMMQHFFERQGWNPQSKTARDRLLRATRRAVALQFDRVVQSKDSALLKWAQGEAAIAPYKQVLELLENAEYPQEEIRSLVAPVVFENLGWKWKKPANAAEALHQEVRYWIASKLGGLIPDQWDFVEHSAKSLYRPKTRPDEESDEYLEPLYENKASLSSLRDWLQEGPEVKFKSNEFYPLLLKFLGELDVPMDGIVPLAVQSLIDRMEGLGSSREDQEKYREHRATLWSLREEYGEWDQRLNQAHGIATEDLKNPHEQHEENVLEALVKRALRTLTPREEKLLRMKFGIGESPSSLKEIGESFEIGPERILFYQNKSLRKLRHPSISKILKPYHGDTSIIVPPLPNPLLEAIVDTVIAKTLEADWPQRRGEVLEHFKSCRYLIPKKYPSLLMTAYLKFLREPFDAQDPGAFQAFLTEKFLDNPNCEEPWKHLLRLDYFREDIQGFLIAHPPAPSPQDSGNAEETAASKDPSPIATELDPVVESLKGEIPMLQATHLALKEVGKVRPNWEDVQNAGEQLLTKILFGPINTDKTVAVRQIYEAVNSYLLLTGSPSKVLDQLYGIEKTWNGSRKTPGPKE